MPQKNIKKPSISKKIKQEKLFNKANWQKFMQQTHLVLIRLSSSEISFKDISPIENLPKLTYDITSESTYKNLTTNLSEIKATYLINIYAKEKDNKVIFATINTTWKCLYKHDSQNFSDEYFKLFDKYTLPFHLYPYFREFVQEIISRAAFPPLTLPFIKP